ncbi:multidrug effflux MFS transporter [Luteimonas abyssi]|uniref:multidrug effflux MFS transporter n=1 Tax=Luteimonas abyssi TaxID=1247514 RepID=UPI000737BF84|nr:multidrug effflux MFS transporter [Luteimonas abyssi]
MSPAVSTRRIALLLAGLAMFGPFSIDTIFPAFAQMGEQFDADKLAMQQTIAVYLIAYALMSIVHGPLSDVLGRRRVILVGLSVFALASVGCALAGDLTTLLVFRALQGLSAGVGLIVGRAVIRDMFDGDDAQRLMSQVSMIFSIAPAIAPIIGGWILGWQRWPMIFWFLVVFSLALLFATWRWLPETHPREARSKLVPACLLRDYAAILLNPRFQRLAAAGAFNFSALFLYIASAPAFVMDILRLDERQFGWFFVPMISGMMLGSWVSGRAAGRISGARLVDIGFVCSGAAIVVNIAYNLTVSQPQLPWAVLPMTLNAFGIALVFPILTLAILDMYPRQRGAASSMQASTSLILNAAVAGLLSPMLSHSALWLAVGGAVFLAIGWSFWRWERRRDRTPPRPSPGPPPIEPSEPL